jgi:hypothetical protein
MVASRKSSSDLSFPQYRFSKPVPERVLIVGWARNSIPTAIHGTSSAQGSKFQAFSRKLAQDRLPLD